MRINDRTYLLRQNELLFSATLDEFSSKFFDLASTNEIIKKSNYNKGSFYYRFKTKDDIYFALIDYVYTTQISLFNNLNIKLKNITEGREIIKIMFAQLKQLYIIDKRYINLMNIIFRESKEFRDYIQQNCVESQLERFLMRLEIILRNILSQKQTEVFLNLISFAYHNENIDFENGFDEYVTNIIDFFDIKSKEHGMHQKEIKFDYNQLHYQFTVILAKYGFLEKNESDKIVYISKLINNETEVIKEIRNNLKIQKVTLDNVIKAGVKKSDLELDHLVSLLSLDYANISFHNLTNLQKAMLLTAYYVIFEKKFIILDYIFKFIYFNDAKNVLKKIIPTLSKTSKIVILEEEINVFPEIFKFIYYINDYGILNSINSEQIPINYSKDVLIDYYDTDGNLRTDYFDRNNPLINEYLNNYKVLNINTFTKISIDDLI